MSDTAAKNKNGDSEERQVRDGTAWAKANKMVIGRTFFDRGVSGFHGSNRFIGEFAKLSKQAKAGDTILIEDNRRFGRDNPLDIMNDLRALCNRGVTIVFFAKGEIINKENFDRKILGLFIDSYQGNQESTYKQDKVGAAWLTKRKAAANGKTVTLALPAWVSAEGDKRILNGRVNVLRRIFKLFKNGASIKRIVRTLNEEKIKPFGKGNQNKSGDWSCCHVARLLRNKSTIGEYQPYRQTKQRDGSITRHADLPNVPDYYPRAIAPES